MTFGTSDCNKTNLCGEGWPNLQCHKLVLSTSEIQELKQKEENLDNLARKSKTDIGNETEELLCSV